MIGHMKFFQYLSSALLLMFLNSSNAQDEEAESRGGPPSPEQMAQMIAELTGAPTGTVIYRDVTLIDGTGAPPKQDVSIVVTRERISAILPSSELSEEQLANAEFINGNG